MKIGTLDVDYFHLAQRPMVPKRAGGIHFPEEDNSSLHTTASTSWNKSKLE
jgi:hypothetical protein